MRCQHVKHGGKGHTMTKQRDKAESIFHEENAKALRAEWDGEEWGKAHIAAMRLRLSPSKPSAGIFHMLTGWIKYADIHHARYETSIGDDTVLGPHWIAIGQAMQGLLDGELGGLDAGTVSTIIVEVMKNEGIDSL